MFDDLINYYRTSHRAGHTTLLVDAAVDYLRRRPYDSLVVFVADAEDAHRIAREIEIAYGGPCDAARVRVLPIRSARDALGLRRPALVDNRAMEILLTEFDVELGCRRARIDTLAEELGIEKRKSAALSKRLKNHEGWLNQKREDVVVLEAHAANLKERLDEKLRDCTALEHRAARAEERANTASTLPADFTVDGKSVADVLAPDAAAGHPAQDVLHAIAREFGWRADWSTGSPITLQAVVDEIRKRRAACEQAGLRTIEADAKRLVAEEQRLDSDMLLASMLGDFKPDATAPSVAELQALLGRISAVACATRAQRLDENRTLASRLSTALSVADGLRRRVTDLEKQLAAEQDARLVAEEQAADLEGQLDEVGERDGEQGGGES